MNVLSLLSARFNSRTLLSLDDVCEATGYRKNTAYNELSAGTFPIPMHKQGKRLFADVRDVANYLDCRRSTARSEHSALWLKMGLPAERDVGKDYSAKGPLAARPSALFLLLGQFDCAVLLTLDQVCAATGYRRSMAYRAATAGTFPIPMRRCGNRLLADVRDVAEYLDAGFGLAAGTQVLAPEAYALISMRRGPGLMDLGAICAAIAWEKSTAYNAISAGTFPVFMRKFGRSWMADPRDVGFYLDEERERLRRPHPRCDEGDEESTAAGDADQFAYEAEGPSSASGLPSEVASVAEPLEPLRVERPRSGRSAQEAIRAILRRKAERLRK